MARWASIVSERRIRLVSEFTYSYEVGTFRNRVYQIGVRADPSLNAVESFAVVLFCELSGGRYIEVAKIDDSKHEEGRVHFDRYYRTDDAERKDFGIEVSSVFEAEDLLEANWRRYVRRYDENHGIA